MVRHVAGIAALSLLIAGPGERAAAQEVDPFQDYNYPLPEGYDGPSYTLSHDYPKTQPESPAAPPWLEVSGGKPLTQDNAIAYVNALKAYIADDMKTLLFDYEHWDAGEAGWYDTPWLFSIRDSIRGTYVGSQFNANMFRLSGLKEDMTTYVVVYYNDLAGYTVGQIWGETAMDPDVSKGQYPEGAIIVKAAFTSASPDDWSPLEGAERVQLYGAPNGPNAAGQTAKPEFFDATLFQFDLIVKDSKSAPETSWVFATLVYDKDVQGDAWDKMVPLGAMWGNDPDVNSAKHPNALLEQSVINPMAPLYAVETLGYGGRLSGPNDGAVVQDVIIDGETVQRVAVSSCMSCHGTSEWPMKSFLLPGPAPSGDSLTIYRPGSDEFNRWMQSRPGNVPQDPGTIALDYDMNIPFKALPLWAKYTGKGRELLQAAPEPLQRFLSMPEQTGKNGRLLEAPR